MTRCAALIRLFCLLLALALLAGCANTRELDAGTTGEASASLFVPYQFQVQAIDSTVLRESFITFDGRDQTLRVAPGRHTLVLRYFDLIEEQSRRMADYERVLSEPITLSFTAEPNTRYAVVGPRPDTPEAGQLFAADPDLAVQEQDSARVVSGEIEVAEPEVRTIRRGNTVYEAVAGAVTGRDTTVAAPGQPGRTAQNADQDVGPAPAAQAADPGPQAAPRSAPPQSFEMLKYWWNTADETTRQRFEAWREAGAAGE